MEFIWHILREATHFVEIGSLSFFLEEKTYQACVQVFKNSHQNLKLEMPGLSSTQIISINSQVVQWTFDQMIAD